MDDAEIERLAEWLSEGYAVHSPERANAGAILRAIPSFMDLLVEVGALAKCHATWSTSGGSGEMSWGGQFQGPAYRILSPEPHKHAWAVHTFRPEDQVIDLACRCGALKNVWPA